MDPYPLQPGETRFVCQIVPYITHLQKLETKNVSGRVIYLE